MAKRQAPGMPFDAAWAQTEAALLSGSFDARRLLSKPVKSGDTEEDSQNRRVFRAKVKIMMLLNYNEDRVLDLCSQVEAAVSTATAKSSSSECFPPGTYMCVKIPTDWRLKFITTRYAKDGLDLQTLQKVDAKDKNAVTELLDFIAGIGPTTRLHASCQSMRCCELWLEKRVNSLGRLTKKNMTDLIQADGSLDWPNHGVFRFAQDGRRLVVKHIDGLEAPWPEEGLSLSNAALLDNHNDLAAAIRIGQMTPIRLRSLFGKGVGPNHPRIVNHKSAVTNALALEAEADYQVEMQDAKAALETTVKIQKVMVENSDKRKSEAKAKRAPTKPPAKRHRTLLGTILQKGAAPAQPLVDAGAVAEE